MEALWDEFDLEQNVWVVPGKRMKIEREHRVAITARARETVTTMATLRAGDFVFPGQRHNRPLSTMALEILLRRLKGDATVHGFRSSFRDWVAEKTEVPREVAEAALAHVLENKVEAAYRRSDFFEKRRQLMSAWAEFVVRPVGAA
jgi:integrase